jgi:hypothetical protein
MGVTFSKYLLLRELFASRFFAKDAFGKYCDSYGIITFESSQGEYEQVKDKVLLKFGGACYLVPTELCKKALVLGEFPSE